MAENYGVVKQVIGPTIDLEFASDRLPSILTAIHVQDKEAGIELITEVAQHIGNDVVRTIAMDSTDGVVRGMKGLDTGGPISVPVGVDRDGLPIGFQVLAPALGEPVMFRVAKTVESLAGFEARPALATSESEV